MTKLLFSPMGGTQFTIHAQAAAQFDAKLRPKMRPIHTTYVPGSMLAILSLAALSCAVIDPS
jgi:hypothetical protein